MTAPRRIVPGEVRFSTYRTVDRKFLFTPDQERRVQQLYWYFTAVLANELGISLHAAQVLSNHIHEVITDNLGRYPDFATQRNRLFANALKVLRKIPGQIFDRSGGSSLVVDGADAILSTIGYTIANVVAAGLAHLPEDWPGVTVAASDIGTTTIRVTRPDIYIDAKNPRWPEVVEIQLTVPDLLLETFGLERGKGRIVSAVTTAVARARESVRARGQKVLTIAEIFAVPFSARASSYEARGKHKPTFAVSGDKERAARALHEKRSFEKTYRIALEAARNGDPNVKFPFGSWRVHRQLGFAVEAPPPPSTTVEERREQRLPSIPVGDTAEARSTARDAVVRANDPLLSPARYDRWTRECCTTSAEYGNRPVASRPLSPPPRRRGAPPAPPAT